MKNRVTRVSKDNIEGIEIITLDDGTILKTDGGFFLEEAGGGLYVQRFRKEQYFVNNIRVKGWGIQKERLPDDPMSPGEEVWQETVFVIPFSYGPDGSFIHGVDSKITLEEFLSKKAEVFTIEAKALGDPDKGEWPNITFYSTDELKAMMIPSKEDEEKIVEEAVSEVLKDLWPLDAPKTNFNHASVVNYNPWPLGNIPEYLRRHEPEMIKKLGYQWKDAREIVTHFEDKLAEFAGCKYAVAVDCCTHAMELSMRYLLYKGELRRGESIWIPRHTYVSVPQMLIRLGFNVQFANLMWTGAYMIDGTRVVDAAVRWRKNMYAEITSSRGDILYCPSFQIKKTIPIGRGGAVLTNDKEAADWIRLTSYDGRDLTTPYDSPEHVKMNGFHYYLTPEDCARGLILMESIKTEGDSGDWTRYPDTQKMLGL